jgi:hypothetical protein
MPTAIASRILTEFDKAQAALVGKAVILTDGCLRFEPLATLP